MAVAATLAIRAHPTFSDNPHTEFGVSIGTAAADRLVFFAFDGPTTFTAISGITIGGIAANKAVEFIGGHVGDNVSVWWAPVPTGTTADIVVTFSGSQTGTFDYVVYSVTGADTTTPVTTSGTQTWITSSASQSVTADVPGDGGAIVFLTGIISHGSLTWTTSGATEQDDSANNGSSATYTTASLQTSHAFTATPSATVPRGAMAVVVLQSSGGGGGVAETNFLVMF